MSVFALAHPMAMSLPDQNMVDYSPFPSNVSHAPPQFLLGAFGARDGPCGRLRRPFYSLKGFHDGGIPAPRNSVFCTIFFLTPGRALPLEFNATSSPLPPLYCGRLPLPPPIVTFGNRLHSLFRTHRTPSPPPPKPLPGESLWPGSFYTWWLPSPRCPQLTMHVLVG